MSAEFSPLLTLGGAGVLTLIGLIQFGVIEGGRIDRKYKARRLPHGREGEHGG